MKDLEVGELKSLLESNVDMALIDVRNAEAWSHGVIEEALLWSSEISKNQLLKLKHKTAIYLICQTGQSSVKLQKQLNKNDFADQLPSIISVKGGCRAWTEAGFPMVQVSMDKAALRYARQLALPGFTEKHQEMLNRSRVLVVGAGGLGSSCLMYLAAAGVGHIQIIDDDQVELSNLHRQIVHGESAIGKNKVASAAARLTDINSSLEITTIKDRVTEHNVSSIIDGVDVVVDGSDNLATRYILNDACYQQSKVLVFSAIYQYEIQASVFDFRAKNSPCYRCLFPKSKAELSESCDQAGVLGVTAGLAGTLQAAETIKCITQTGEPLTRVLLTWNVLNHRHKMIKYKINPQCAHGQ